MALAPLSAGFQSLPQLPTIKLGPSGADSRVGGLVHALGPCGSLQQPLLWGWEFLLLPPQPPRVFSIRGLRLYFPELEPWVAQSASLPCLSSRFIYVRMWGRRVCQLSHCLSRSFHSLPPLWVQPRIRESPGPQLPVSTPPTGLDECFFFISLAVRLPCGSIFLQAI